VKNAEFINGLNGAMRQFALDRQRRRRMNYPKNHYDQLSDRPDSQLRRPPAICRKRHRIDE
jgi:hypothetical protein